MPADDVSVTDLRPCYDTEAGTTRQVCLSIVGTPSRRLSVHRAGVMQSQRNVSMLCALSPPGRINQSTMDSTVHVGVRTIFISMILTILLRCRVGIDISKFNKQHPRSWFEQWCGTFWPKLARPTDIHACFAVAYTTATVPLS